MDISRRTRSIGLLILHSICELLQIHKPMRRTEEDYPFLLYNDRTEKSVKKKARAYISLKTPPNNFLSSRKFIVLPNKWLNG